MITLDLPHPFSVNAARKIDWESMAKRKKWLDLADCLIMESRQNRQNAIIGPFEAHLILSENTRNDLDNCIKVCLDYAVRLKMVSDDSPDYFRKLTVEFGEAPQGARLILKPFEQMAPHVTGSQRRAIVDYLWRNRHGVTREQILNAVYGDRVVGLNTISVIIHHANKQLACHLWRIRSTLGPGALYFLERIEKAAPEEAA